MSESDSDFPRFYNLGKQVERRYGLDLFKAVLLAIQATLKLSTHVSGFTFLDHLL